MWWGRVLYLRRELLDGLLQGGADRARLLVQHTSGLLCVLWRMVHLRCHMLLILLHLLHWILLVWGLYRLWLVLLLRLLVLLHGLLIVLWLLYRCWLGVGVLRWLGRLGMGRGLR